MSTHTVALPPHAVPQLLLISLLVQNRIPTPIIHQILKLTLTTIYDYNPTETIAQWYHKLQELDNKGLGRKTASEINEQVH